MAYKRDVGELVGVWTFEEIEKGKHLAPLEERMQESGLTNTYAEYALDRCVPYGLKIYLVAECDRRDIDKKPEFRGG